MKKVFGPFFPHIIECHKHQRTNYKGPQPILTITVEIIRPFLWGHLRSLKTQMCQKQGNLSNGEKTLASSFLFYRTWKETGNTLWGSKGCFNVDCAIDKNIYWDLSGRQEQTFQKKAFFAMTKVFGLFFLVLSSMKNMKEQNAMVRIFFWHLLWNW